MPLFRGESHTIVPAALTVLAQWAVKTVLLYEQMRYEERARYFTVENRRALFRSLAIPPRTLVFAARYSGEDGTYGIGGQMPELFPGALPRSEAHCSSFAIKQLALQVFSFRPPQNYVGGRLSVSIPFDAWAGVQEIIWPIQGPVVWPPKLALDRAGFEVFAERWRRANVRP
jgi:hypothetical protein